VEVLGASVAATRESAQGTRVLHLDIPGLVVIEPRSFGDARGFFVETYHAQRYAALGVDASFVQDNLSFSPRGVLRGLHFQLPRLQAKLVSVIAGEVLDVAVDIRRGSPTFGRWAAVLLDGDSRRQFFVPRGFAHGFCVLSDAAHFSYKCDDYYAPADERCIAWDDPDLAIRWPLSAPTLSAKDAAGVRLADIVPAALPEWPGGDAA
jgi:dTDP-4-dehydrorhamnose 3,5-epimerase